MGLGGYLAARTDRDHYQSEREREIRETVEVPEKETEEVADVFRGYGMSEEDIAPGGEGRQRRPEALGGFHDALRAGLRGARPQRARATAPSTIAVSYIAGRPGAAGARTCWSATSTRRSPVLGGGDADRALRLRLRQRQADGHFAACAAACRRASSGDWPRPPHSAWRDGSNRRDVPLPGGDGRPPRHRPSHNRPSHDRPPRNRCSFAAS